MTNPLSNRTRALLGFSDQAVSSISNFGVVLLASRALSGADFGALVVGLSLAYIAVGVGRAVIGDPALVHLSPLPDGEARQLTKDGLTAAVLLGVVFAILSSTPILLGPDLFRYSLLVGIWAPALLLQDAGRYVCLSRRRPELALLSDSVWLIAQIGLTAAFAVAHELKAGTIVGAWGAAALAGAGTGLLAMRIVPTGQPHRWVRVTMDMSKWNVPASVLGQTQDQVVLLLAATLVSEQAAGALRAAQLLLVQPLLISILACNGLLIPWAAKRVASQDFETLSARLKLVSLICFAFSFVPLATIPFRDSIMNAVFPNLRDFSDVLIAAAVQAAATFMLLPGAVLIRSTRQARPQFLLQLVATLTAVAATATGALVADATGAAWGKAAGTILFVVGLLWFGFRYLAVAASVDKSMTRDILSTKIDTR